jgi:hypothetical protein
MIFAKADIAEGPAAIKPVGDWRKLHWKQRVKLANELGAGVTTDAEAKAFLGAL